VINFRYHVVSLTAVFLALAIGLVVGTAALNGPVADSFKDQVEQLNRSNSATREQVTVLQEAARRQQGFAVEAAPMLVGGKLSGRKILMVVLPSGQDYADTIATMLTTAGATLTGRVTVQGKYFEPGNDQELLGLAYKASQPTVRTADLPLNSDGVETSSALLANALMARTPAVVQADVKGVLAAYTAAEYIAISDGTVGGADGAVLVTGAADTGKDAVKKNQKAVTLATQWSKDRPLVIAGTGVGVGNTIGEVRADPTLLKLISTVDNADAAQGALVTAMATAERVVQQRAGHYGSGAGATSLLPKPAAG
jgi:hypothetical protein